MSEPGEDRAALESRDRTSERESLHPLQPRPAELISGIESLLTEQRHLEAAFLARVAICTDGLVDREQAEIKLQWADALYGLGQEVDDQMLTGAAAHLAWRSMHIFRGLGPQYRKQEEAAEVYRNAKGFAEAGSKQSADSSDTAFHISALVEAGYGYLAEGYPQEGIKVVSTLRSVEPAGHLEIDQLEAHVNRAMAAKLDAEAQALRATAAELRSRASTLENPVGVADLSALSEPQA